MRETYIYENDCGKHRIKKVQDAVAVPALLQACETEDFESMEPMFAAGDPELAYCTAFRDAVGAGGVVLVAAGSAEPLFYVICNNNLDLIAAASHFASMVSNIRYGQDIFDGLEDED